MSKQGKPPFVAEYHHNGKLYGITVGGDSWEEAERHLVSIGQNGRIIGSDCVSIPVNDLTVLPVTLWGAFTCWLKNMWARR